MTAPLRDSEGNLWFEIDPDDFDADMADEDDPDDPYPDPRMDPAPRAFVHRLREMSSTWRELGLTHRQTSGLYGEGRVRVLVPAADVAANLHLGDVRVDFSESEWIGSWVRGGDPGAPDLEDAEPMGEPVRESFTDLREGIERASGWLLAQLERPIVRRIWRSGGEIVAQSWTFEDTGAGIAASGGREYWSRPETADETVQVQPRRSS